MNHKQVRSLVAAGLMSIGCFTAFALPAFAQDGVVKAVAIGEATPKEPGVLLTSVRAESPAAAAGLKRGDIVLTVDGEEVNTDSELRVALADKKAGEEVILSVQHGDDVKEVKVTLAPRDDSGVLGVQAESSGSDFLFQQAMPFAPGAPFRPGIQAPGGGMHWQFAEPISPTTFAFSQTLQVQIAEVTADSPADKAGLKAGDVIVAVNGTAIEQPDALVEVVAEQAPGDKITLTVKPSFDASDEREAVVTLGERKDDATKAYLGIRVAPAIFFTHAEANAMPGQFAPAMPALEFPQATEAWTNGEMSADVMILRSPPAGMWTSALPTPAPFCYWPIQVPFGPQASFVPQASFAPQASFGPQAGVQVLRAEPGMRPEVQVEHVTKQMDAGAKVEIEQAAQPDQQIFQIETAPIHESDEI